MVEVIEGSGEDDWAIPIKDVEDWTGEPEMESLNYLGSPELEGGVC